MLVETEKKELEYLVEVEDVVESSYDLAATIAVEQPDNERNGEYRRGRPVRSTAGKIRVNSQVPPQLIVFKPLHTKKQKGGKKQKAVRQSGRAYVCKFRPSFEFLCTAQRAKKM